MNTALDAIARAKARLAEIKQEVEAKKKFQETAIAASMKQMLVPSLHTKGWWIDDSTDWNEEQLQAINAGMASKSFCLIGAAGVGKTTTLKGIVSSKLRNHLVPPITQSTKWLTAGNPGIVLCSFTNMAVRQIAKHFSKDVTCITIHKLLEFSPVKYEVDDGAGGFVTKMKFEPMRHRNNPLPAALTTIIVDEASMVDCDLFELLLDALPDPAAVQFIFLGDLNQLPPVYGGPILGRKLLELPIIELTRVYRQALESPIIRFAIRMKDGLATPVSQQIVEDNGEHGKVTIHPWSKAISWEDGLLKMQGFLKAAIRDGFIDPLQDMVLCPYNVNFGVVELNRAVADYLGRQRGAVVHEVVAGFETHYFAVGDKMLAQKQEAVIIAIRRNSKYTGKRPIDPDRYEIDRYGGAKKRTTATELTANQEFQLENDFDVDALLESMQTTTVEDRVHASSHRIYLVPKLTWVEETAAGKTLEEIFEEHNSWYLETASEVNEMLFGYCITVHKSQGSEWRKVFLITHNSHAKMCSRELMYTAMTRAKQELYMIVEPDRGMKAGTLTSAAKKPRLKGNTLAEKLVSLREKFEKEAKEAQGTGAGSKQLLVKEESDTVNGAETDEGEA
jgi:ATP-dependent exoDNAse (exonuclease V) alpha subunit